MSTKGVIRNSGTFLGATPTATDGNLRQAVIEQQWHNYLVTNDLECLAQICEHADYFGNIDIGRALARELRGKSRRTKGYEASILWNEACRLYDLISNHPSWDGASNDAKRCYVGEQIGFTTNKAIAEIIGVKDNNLELWSDRFRKQLEKRSQTK
jgi:hypothetical protein